MITLITIDQILQWGPCEDYDTAEKIIERTGPDWPKTPIQICDLNIPAEDRLWVLLREEIIPAKKLHLLACDFAEHALCIYESQYPGDARPRDAIQAKRDWVAGRISDEELKAARDAAQAAVWAAARAAAWCAAEAAVWAAVWAAAWIAGDAEREYQLGLVRRCLDE